MALNEQEAETITSYLNQIYEKAYSTMNDQDRFQVRQYIEVEEFGLALDDLADFVLKSGKPITTLLRSLFAAAAERMAITPGTGWSAVDDLLRQ